jgi:T5SS/PEP-CTERM-associated repeat protein
MPSPLAPSARAAALALSLLLLATTASPSRAAEQLWYGTFNNNWWNVGNWLGIAIPAPTDTVFFGHDFSILRSTVNLDANATVAGLHVDSHPPNNEYLFQRTNNSVLTINDEFIVSNTVSPNFVNLVTMSGFHLNAKTLRIQDFTRLNAQNNSQLVVTYFLSIGSEAELSMTSGTLEMGAGSLARVGGKLSIGQNTTLGNQTRIEVEEPTGLLSVTNGFNFNNASQVAVYNGGDVVGNGFIDIGNTGSSSVGIKGAGSTWTAAGTSDWGRTATGNATVRLEDGAQATLDNLRMGEVDASSLVTVTSGSHLTVNGAFSAGGGTADRVVRLNAGNPLLDGNENFVAFNGISTFNSKAVLDSNHHSTITFNQNATFNEGSRFERSFGSTLNIASGKKLIINGGVYEDATTGGQELSAGAGIEVRGAFARFNVADYFDIGAGSLLVELNGQVNSPSGATITDWGSAPFDVMTADIRTGGRVNIGDLRIADSGTATVTIASGGQLNPRHLTTGGKPGASANLFFDGGQATISGNANLGQGTVFTISDPVGDFSAQTGNVAIVGDLNLTGNAQLATVGVDPGLNIQGNLNTATGTQIQTGGNTFFGVGQSATLNGGAVSLFGTSKMNVTENLTLGVAGGGAGSLTINPGTRLNVGDLASAIVDNNYSYVEDSSANASSGGTIFVRNGATLTNSNSGFSVGENAGKSGRIVVSGAGSTVNDATTYLGWAGTGTVNVDAGGRFVSEGAQLGASGGAGVLTIAGAGSQMWSKRDLEIQGSASSIALSGGGSLAVGDAAGSIPNAIVIADSNPVDADSGGLLTIAGGSTVTTPGLVFLSRNTAHSGQLVVTGAGSTLTANTVFVAERGRGVARIEAGGKVIATDQFQVGSEVEGIGTAAITGAGSTLTANFLAVGLFSEGDMEIENGGKAVASAANIGQFAGSSGAILVRGADSRLEVANGLTVGNLGSGALNVQSGGVVTAANVTVNSLSSLNLSGSSVVQSNIDNSGLLSAFNSSVTGGVTLRTSSQMSFDNATIGSLTQHASDLLVNLRGASDFDNLIVTGAASLGGDVVVSLSPGFSPTLGAQFPILTASSITGIPTFDFSAAPLANGLTWNVALSPTSLSLVVASAGIPGDFNLNGLVDGADFLLWQRGGSPNPLSSSDLAIWKSNFGVSASATSTASAVPEPHAWLLSGAAGLALWRRRG